MFPFQLWLISLLIVSNPAQISSKKSKDIKTAKDLISRPKTVLKSVDSYIEKKHHVLSQLEL